MDRVPLGQSPIKTETEPTSPVHEGEWQGTVSYLDDINYHRMSDLLEVSYEDRKDVHLAEKIAFLSDWAKEQTQSEDRLIQYEAIKNLTRSLGFQSTGKDLLIKLHRWTRLDSNRRRLEKEMNLIT